MKLDRLRQTLIFCISAVLLLAIAALESTNAAESRRQPPPPPEAIAKLPPDGGPEFNRLVFEKSPYLLQHARNPVEWYPWGDEAFAKARAEKKPIFLSIGYSTCHWCHVMETESFEDAEVAALLNKDFVAIKVDREERPDIDQIYMTVTQAMTGGGGWPMTIVMTPEKKPFFAGTYFPKNGRGGQPGMMELLPRLIEVWTTRRADAEELAGNLAKSLGELAESAPGDAPDVGLLLSAVQELRGQFDSEHGGFGTAPKFPQPQNLALLLRAARKNQDPKLTEMVALTLDAMRAGGIYDHIGFGFHRYSTDPLWLVSHFEKMLYDQALIAMAYLEAFQATKNESYAATAREIFTYVLRDMTSPEGGFYSAEDADSEGEEGKFYLWKSEEIRSVLGPDDGAIFEKTFNIRPEGNFTDPHASAASKNNIPHLTLKSDPLPASIGPMRERLFAEREKRVHPGKDDKILTDWNGLMIAALARGGAILDEPRYAEAARRAADFVLARLRTPEGRLLKRYRAGAAGLPSHLEDYAFLVWGLLELYEATFEIKYLESAVALNETMIQHFADEKRGGFFQTADDGEVLLMRPKDAYDGAIPSGNAVAAMNLLRIGRMTGKPELEERAAGVFRAFASSLKRSPSSHAQMLLAVDFMLGPTQEIVIAGKSGAEDTRAMLRALRIEFIPNKVVLFRPDGEADPVIAALAPFTREQLSREGKATAYVCRNYACKAPVTDVGAMLAAIRGEK